MSTGNLNLKRRLTILFYSFLIFLFLNVLRILVLIELYGTNIFIFAHWFLWNVMSTLFVVGIWFFMVKIYKIKSYPFLTDFYNFLNFVDTIQVIKEKS
jgi:exosortase/archaeosortase